MKTRFDPVIVYLAIDSTPTIQIACLECRAVVNSKHFPWCPAIERERLSEPLTSVAVRDHNGEIVHLTPEQAREAGLW